MKISHSARGKYDFCPRMYRNHYIDKIRPVGTTSSLLFGSAIDAAAEHYLLNGDKELAIEMFNNKWNEQEINGSPTILKTCTEIEFHRNDFDHELLSESDNEAVIEGTVFKTSSDLVEDGTNKERVTLANWLSLYRKGLIILDGFMKWADNNVDEVLEAQSLIELESEPYFIINEAGEEVEVRDEIGGKADFVFKLKWYDVPLLVDLKTAARFYERGSVRESEQLALYYFFLKNTKYPEMKRASFLVLQKQIKKNREKTCQKCGTVTKGKEQSCSVEIDSGELITKGKNKGKPKMERCDGEFDVQIFPEATVQFIYDEIPEEFIERIIDEYGIVIENIQAGNFEKNLDGCNSYYGRECPYKKYCESGCMNGLIKKEET